MNIVNSLWVEKYRPKKLSDLILPDEYRQDFEVSIKNKEIANLLLFGPPGSGKTALSMILASKNGVLENPSDNLLHINGSSKESRGIGFVDTVIEPYLKIPPAGNDKNKIVFIDEADYVTDAAVHSLRAIIEKYSKYARFIFTCNYVSKIPEAIRSRTQEYEFKQMPIDFVVDYCKKILEKENVTFKEENVKYVCENLYPDIRRIINSLQKNSATGDLRVSKDIVLTNEKIILSLIVEIITYAKNNEMQKIGGCMSNILQVLSKQHDMEYRSIYSELFFKKEIPPSCKIIINKYTNSHNDCLVPSMHFTAMIFEVIKTLQDYNKAVGAK